MDVQRIVLPANPQQMATRTSVVTHCRDGTVREAEAVRRTNAIPAAMATPGSSIITLSGPELGVARRNPGRNIINAYGPAIEHRIPEQLRAGGRA